MSTRIIYEPTAALLAEAQIVPFVDAEHCDESEKTEADFADRMARRRARWESREQARVELVRASIERIRREGRVETFGHPTGYAYRVGQATRRAAR